MKDGEKERRKGNLDCTIRPWRLDDAKELALIANNKKIQNNLRDGLPYPYTEKDAESYIGELLSSDKNTTFGILSQFFCIFAPRNPGGALRCPARARTRSSMDRISDSGSDDRSSNLLGFTPSEITPCHQAERGSRVCS